MSGNHDVPAVRAGDRATLVDRPLFTYCDDATGERVELSATALGAWASRTAARLQPGCGRGPGGRVAVLLAAHWADDGRHPGRVVGRNDGVRRSG